MASKNPIILAGISAILLIAVIIGRNSDSRPGTSIKHAAADVPYLGRVQVLNGCGRPAAADKMADFLRGNNFDVKHIGNTPDENYPFTMVVSRKKDMVIARQIENVLHTGHCILLCTDDKNYDATVITGPDYQKRIRR